MKFYVACLPLVLGLAPVKNLAAEKTNSQNFNLLMTGDWGGRAGGKFENYAIYGDNVGKSMNRFAGQNPVSGIFLLGDNFYNNGVQNAQDARFNETFQATFNGSNLQNIQFPVISGNHDYHGNVTAQMAYTKLDPTNRWFYPKLYHKLSYLNGLIDILMIDTQALKNEYQFDAASGVDHSTEQFIWIENQLAESTAEFVFVIGHYPLYTASIVHGNDQFLIDTLQPIMNKYHVTSYIAAHDHVLSHIHSKSSDRKDKTPPTKYDFWIAGAANKIFPGRNVRNCGCVLDYFWAKVKSKGAYLNLNYDGEKCILKFIDAGSDSVLYESEVYSRSVLG